MSDDAGFNLIGHLTTRMGLGRAARMTLGVIEVNRWPASIVDVTFGGLERIPLTSSATVAELASLPYSTTLLHMNPEQVVDGLLVWDHELLATLSKRYLATVPYWELPDLPAYWNQFLRGMDEVLAPSRFVEATITRALEGVPFAPRVSYFAQAVQPPVGVVAERDRWFGPRNDTTVFLASFDVVSDPARKNPEAVVEAFCEASQGRQDMTLALKVGYSSSAAADSPYCALAEKAASDPRIVLIEETLSDRDFWSLLASADAYVSLHRAEGLGLGMMESMALGTPVIGTNWSGNTDFMTAEDSILIPYRLVSVQASHVPLYREMSGTSQWADPDVHAAAQAMRDLTDDSELRIRLGGAALDSAERRWLDYQRADTLSSTLAESTQLDRTGSERRRRLDRLDADVRMRRRIARLNRLRPPALIEGAKRLGVSVLRNLRLMPAAPEHEVRVTGRLEVVDPYDSEQHPVRGKGSNIRSGSSAPVVRDSSGRRDRRGPSG